MRVILERVRQKLVTSGRFDPATIDKIRRTGNLETLVRIVEDYIEDVETLKKESRAEAGIERSKTDG